MKTDMDTTVSQERPAGAGGFWLVAAMGTAISATTSWMFFDKVLHIADRRERAAMFAVLEVMFLALGWATRANVRRDPDGKPGAARAWAWVLCGVAAYMAFAVSGLVGGVGRVFLGPVMALIALHLALGIEVRAKHGGNTGTWAKIRNEVKERFLSRFGLGNDQRDAAARTRDRARDRAARLIDATGWVPARRARVAKAVRASGATRDADQRARLVEQIATMRHLKDLASMPVVNPWVSFAAPGEDVPEDLTEVITGVVTSLLSGHLGEDRTGHLMGDSTSPLIRDLTGDRTRTAADPSPETSPKLNPTAVKIAKLRGRYPQLTQAQVSKRAGVSVATAQRYWSLTFPAVEQPKVNGHPVPDLVSEASE